MRKVITGHKVKTEMTFAITMRNSDIAAVFSKDMYLSNKLHVKK